MAEPWVANDDRVVMLCAPRPSRTDSTQPEFVTRPREMPNSGCFLDALTAFPDTSERETLCYAVVYIILQYDRRL